MFNDEILTTMQLFKAFTHIEILWCQEQWAQRTCYPDLRSGALLHLSRLDLVSKVQPASKSAATPVLKPSRAGDLTSVKSATHISQQVLAPIPCWAFLEMHSRFRQDPSMSRAIQLYQNWMVGVQHSTEGILVCTMSTTLMLTATEESTRKSVPEPPSIGAEPHPTGTVNVVFSTSSSRAGRGCVLLAFLAPPGLSSSPTLISCFWPRIPSDFRLKRACSSSSASATAPRFIDVDSSGVAVDIAMSCCSKSVGSPAFSLLAPGPLQPQVPHLACICGLANARDPQNMLHLLANPCPILIRVRCCCLRTNGKIRTRCTTDCHTILSQACPRDVAPTWRQRKMDNFRTWGLNSPCSFCSTFSDIPKKTPRSTPTVNIPSTLLIHSSKHCSFHESIPSDLPPFEGAEGLSTVVSHASNTTLGCFVFARVARCWCIRCRYHSDDTDVMHHVH